MKEKGVVNPPQWSEFVKTGVHTERPPESPDWWFTRAASVLRQVYMRGPIGVGKLRNWYGGRKKRGSRPERHYRAGGKIIRTCLQQLEGAGFIAKEGAGRKITAKGQSVIDKAAASLKPRVERKPKAPKKPAAKKAPSNTEKKASAKKPAKAEAPAKGVKPTMATPAKKATPPKGQKPQEAAAKPAAPAKGTKPKVASKPDTPTKPPAKSKEAKA